jgi:ABC-type sugar transport system ATPase subunit
MNQDYLQIRNVSKSYGAVRALDGVSFSVRKGSIHAVLGENGAGKSTLMKLIKGELAPDSGQVRLDGADYARYDPAYTRELGVLMVHQELAVFGNLSVAENLFPDLERFRCGGLINTSALMSSARESLATFELDIDPAAPLSRLTLGQKQLVEILRALGMPRRLLILDEPTSGLSTVEADRLMQLLGKLRDGGETILFISHRIPEILSACDEVSVLRDGRYIETFDCRLASEDELVRRMAGREAVAPGVRRRDQVRRAGVALQVNGLSLPHRLDDIRLSVGWGEVVGVFGLEGSGSSELAPAIFGLRHASGSVTVGDVVVTRWNPYEMRRHKVSFVNTNRKEAGLFMHSSIALNVAAPVLTRFTSCFGLLRMGAVQAFARQYAQRFAIKAADTGVAPITLSGGNQQKVMVAAALADEPDVILINEPTRGVDVSAKAEIHRHLQALADAGKGLLVMSSDLPELISLCDRIIVMRARRIAGQCEGDSIDPAAVMQLAAGHLATGVTT